jgi:hypothetical protein
VSESYTEIPNDLLNEAAELIHRVHNAQGAADAWELAVEIKDGAGGSWTLLCTTLWSRSSTATWTVCSLYSSGSTTYRPSGQMTDEPFDDGVRLGPGAHGVWRPPDQPDSPLGMGFWWHCTACWHYRSRTRDAVRAHFIAAHPQELLQWYRDSQWLIAAAQRLGNS